MGKHNCEACKKKCKKEAIFLQEKYYHLDCFTCSECKKPLNMNDFYSKNGKHFCPDDYQRLFIVTVKCDACNKPAKDEVISVLGKSFHQECFKCSGCNKLFHSGEKVTLSKGKFQCMSCCKVAEEALEKMEGTETSMRKEAIDESSIIPNGTVPMDSPLKVNDLTLNDTRVLDKSIQESKEASKSLPKVFGMPDSRFYNISYLERADNSFRRGPTSDYKFKSQLSTHYHRPDNFSYNNFRKDFLPDRMSYLEKMSFTRRSETHDSLLPIERDDWPGPPEPAAAYPELLREKDFNKATVVNVEGETTKQMEELEKMSKDSGAAAVLLKDFQKKKEDSPFLDPRNASRTPSAAVEPNHKPRYETPYYASPSRHLDMLPQRSHSTDNTLLKTSPRDDVTRPYTSLAVRSGYSIYHRTGSSMEARNDYLSASEMNDSRPESAADGSFSGRFSSMRIGEIDPGTGLRISRHSRASTLPMGLSGLSSFTKMATGSIRSDEPPKIYSFKELCGVNEKQLPGVNRDALESHLSKDEFRNVFRMEARDFYLLPPWQRNELKFKVGLQ